MWWHSNPLRQFRLVKSEVISKLEDKKMSLNRLRDMEAKDIGALVR